MRFSCRWCLTFVLGFLLGFSWLPACVAQNQLPQPVPPNVLLPQGPAQRAKLSQWRPAEGRSTLTLTLGDTVLRGYLYAGSNAKLPTVLFFNGSGQIVADNDGFYRKLASLGPSIAVYDYAGVGFSSGNQDVMDYRADGLKVYDQVAEQAPSHTVMVYGYSMGTVVAAYVANQRSVAGLVLAAPIGDARQFLSSLAESLHMARIAVLQLRISDEATQAFGEAALLAHYTAPLLVIHGSADSLIPFTQGKEVFAACPAKEKYFIEIKGADHEGLPVQIGALQSFARFVTLVPRPAP